MSIFYLDPVNEHFKPGQPVKTRLVNQDGVGPLEGFVYTLGCLPWVIFLIFMAVYLLVTALYFLTSGITTSATVESCVYDPPRALARGNSNASIDLTYRYNTEAGMVEATETVVNNWIKCDAAPIGSTIQIQYVPSGNSQVTDPRLMPPFLDRYSVYLVFPIMLAFSGVYTFLGIRGMVHYFQARRAAFRLREGVVLNGELIEATGKTHGKGNSLFHVYVTYQFTTPTGVAISGKQRYLRDDLNGKPLPEEGRLVKILYVADDCYVML